MLQCGIASGIVRAVGQSAGGGRRGGGRAELQDHLRVSVQGELTADEGAGCGILEWLGVQGCEYPMAGGVQQQPVQGLPSAQPIRAPVTRGEEDSGSGWGCPAGGKTEDVAAEVKVALRQPTRRWLPRPARRAAVLPAARPTAGWVRTGRGGCAGAAPLAADAVPGR